MHVRAHDHLVKNGGLGLAGKDQPGSVLHGQVKADLSQQVAGQNTGGEADLIRPMLPQRGSDADASTAFDQQAIDAAAQLDRSAFSGGEIQHPAGHVGERDARFFGGVQGAFRGILHPWRERGKALGVNHAAAVVKALQQGHVAVKIRALVFPPERPAEPQDRPEVEGLGELAVVLQSLDPQPEISSRIGVVGVEPGEGFGRGAGGRCVAFDHRHPLAPPGQGKGQRCPDDACADDDEML